MKSDVCGKNDATIHVTEIINGEVKELHICDDCAKSKGMIKNNKNFGLADFLAGLTDFGITPKDTQELEDFDLRCPKCGLSFEDFKRVGRLGCGECYDAFKDGLAPLLRKIHGSSRHAGNIPKEATNNGKIFKKTDSNSDLEEKLKTAINNEEFEEAARLRDLIRGKKKKKI
jgi:protein arginine kinase activator